MITPIQTVVGVSLLAAFMGELAEGVDNPLVRQTRFGAVEGYANSETGVWGWKSIPFAKPPIGDLRWRSPQDPETWEGVRDAKEPCDACIQPRLDPPLTILPEVTGSEDCLYLNIFRPQTDEANLPVYFWIHGGGNVFGSASGWYVEDIARKANMVVVEVQYRLGVVGYFTHPAIRSGIGAAEASGNFGTLDQIKALKWVRDNVASFGGNPYNVTIAGHSAGGHDVAHLTICPLARGLFHRAVIQSGIWVAQSIADIDQTANRTIDQLLIAKGLAKNADDAHRVRLEMSDAELVSLLKSVPASELTRAHFSTRPNPVWSFVIADGVVIPDLLLRVVQSGCYAKVPTIIGVTKNEAGFAHITTAPQYQGMPDYRDLARVAEGEKTLDEVLPTPKDKEDWLKARHYGSLFSRAMANEHARRLALWQDDVYVFSFNWGDDAKVSSKILTFTFGAGHCMENPFIFGNLDKEDLWLATSALYRGFTEANRPGRMALSDVMVSYLSQFVRTGNPNSAASGAPEWKAWSNHAGGPKALQLDADLTAAKIAMDTQEVSIAGVRYALDSEPPDTRRHVLAVVSVIQPYAVYEPGDYEHGSGR